MQCHVPADRLPSAPACRRCQVHFLWHVARCSKLRSSPWPCGQRYSLHKTKISSDLCLVCFIATFSHLHNSSQYSLYLKIWKYLNPVDQGWWSLRTFFLNRVPPVKMNYSFSNKWNPSSSSNFFVKLKLHQPFWIKLLIHLSFSNPKPHLKTTLHLDCRLRKCVIHRWNVRRTFRKTCGIWWQNMLNFNKHVKRKLKRNFDNLYLEQGIKASITTPSTFVGFSPGQPEHRYFAFETAYSYPLWPQKKAVTQH